VDSYYFFEIVERPDDRHSWILVRLHDRRRRVIARASRDYESRDDALAAVDRFKERVQTALTAPIVLEPAGYEFEIVPDVVSLPVGSPGSDRDARPASNGPFVTALPSASRAAPNGGQVTAGPANGTPATKPASRPVTPAPPPVKTAPPPVKTAPPPVKTAKPPVKPTRSRSAASKSAT
jgi:hypothetical protein